MRHTLPFFHAHHDAGTPAPNPPGGTGELLAQVPRTTPEVMESIAVALLSLTAPGVCLRAGADPAPQAGGAGNSAGEPAPVT